MSLFFFIEGRKVMALYLYNGPVTRFGKYVGNYKAYTTATSEKQAYNNIKSKWKNDCGYLQSAKVELPGKIEIIKAKGEN